MRRLAVRLATILVMALSLVSSMPGAAAATSPSATDPDGLVVTATYREQPIDPAQASHYFCHTRDYPVVRCFATQAEVDNDLGLVEPQAPGVAPKPGDTGAGAPLQAMSVAYTIAYWDINYGGSALTVYGAVPSLGVLGWNDSISSIKSVNCGVPRYYVDASYRGLYWQNSCNTWSPNLYSSNDTFSSVLNAA
jgi:hypothetical protein